MAKRVDRWLAEDGAEFHTEAEADYHTKTAGVKAALRKLLNELEQEDDDVGNFTSGQIAAMLVAHPKKFVTALVPLLTPGAVTSLNDQYGAVKATFWQKLDRVPAIQALDNMLPIAVDLDNKAAEWLYDNLERVLAACYQTQCITSGPVAFFDNEGQVRGRVSDEQLEVLCRNGIAQLQYRNGWPNDEADSSSTNHQEQRELRAVGEQIRATEFKTVRWEDDTYQVPHWASYIGEDTVGRLFVWANKPAINEKGTFDVPPGVMTMLVVQFNSVKRVHPLLVHIEEAA